MDLNKFNDYYFNELLHKLSSENKYAVLLGDFNVDLIKYDNHHISQPARLRDSSNTLIDNISPNTVIENTTSGNLTATISDHLPQ